MQPLPRLDGRTVLLVEDDSMVSMLTEDVLRDAGGDVVLAMRLAPALSIAHDDPISAAVLDINLGEGETRFPVAELLADRQIPFLFVTGYDCSGIDRRFAACPLLQKPYDPAVLVGAVAAIASGPG